MTGQQSEKHTVSRLSSIINLRRSSAEAAVNSEQIMMCWEIGRLLAEDVPEYGTPEYDSKIEEISLCLAEQYGRGYDRSTVFRMVQFYRKFPEAEKVATLSQQLTWSHFIELISIEDKKKRDFYAAVCYAEHWSVSTLRERRKSMLYERAAISRKPGETIAHDISQLRDEKKMSLDMFYRDPYILDFLGLKDTYAEKDLENAILDELEKFILEMGSDFAFLARQKHFVLDGKDYYMDLLFFHRTLRRLVLVELKLGEFEPSYKGQVELYLRWLDKYERTKDEESPVALILCAEKSQETIELMELNEGNIHVGQYLTKMPSKEILEKKLSEAISNAREMLSQRGYKENKLVEFTGRDENKQ